MQQSHDASQSRLTARIKAAGCAAKISAGQLAQIVSLLPPADCDDLLAGIAGFEDAAVFRLSSDLALVQTIDFFPPVVDDAYMFGRIAAVNALSDIYAMGGRPQLALNILGFPVCRLEIELAQQIVKGGAEAVQQAGAVLCGGHSIQSDEPLYGLSVTGFVHPDRILTNSGARAGDAAVLCKALGTGVALLALKAEELGEPAKDELFESLTRLNDRASEIALAGPVHACTDVTGFGLIGHLHEMARASGLAVEVDSASVPLISGVLSLAEMGLVPAGAYANRQSYEEHVKMDSIDLSLSDLLYDPQTAGGLLLAAEADRAPEIVKSMQCAGYRAAVIGRFEPGPAGRVEVRA